MNEILKSEVVDACLHFMNSTPFLERRFVVERYDNTPHEADLFLRGVRIGAIKVLCADMGEQHPFKIHRVGLKALLDYGGGEDRTFDVMVAWTDEESVWFTMAHWIEKNLSELEFDGERIIVPSYLMRTVGKLGI